MTTIVETATIEKMRYEGVDAFHDTLCFAFHPDGLGDDEDLDDRFLALWHLFLAATGWTECEFWEEYHSREHHCHDCGSTIDTDGNHLDEDGKIIEEDDDLPSIEKISATDKPN